MRTSIVVLVLALAACGSSTKQSQEPVVGPPQVAWKDMNPKQRGAYMAAVVMPTMKATFQAFDAKKFAKFDCKTCHGDDGEKKEFKMPNAGLYELPHSPEGFGQLAKDKPEYMKFMATQVKPQMAKLLGLEEFDPASPKPGTFGCMACHATEKK